MGDIVDFNGKTFMDIDCKKILDAVDPDEMDLVMVLGWSKEDNLYASSSSSDIAEMIYLMELFKHKLLNGDYQ